MLVEDAGLDPRRSQLVRHGGLVVNYQLPPVKGAAKDREEAMPIYMHQFTYTPESWAAQIKNPQNRMETVGPALCKAAGGKMIGAWLCFGEYDGS